MKTLHRIPVELIFWITALALLAFAEPIAKGHIHHFTLCPLANMGIDWCPGCGIGRAITQLFHGNIKESLAQHWFGIPALMIIVHRIIELINRRIDNNRKLKYKEERYV
ncbi:DUF2752 domain-containing protein [Pedobacter gandavensis]|uniref:DUF2752 domain-containing protein n=1 Tax=Pedobacter gandavensis TaxID=2679963 RepID=UPI002931859A|nr:DUF2752 domain-containing protein [Pedobacter gandavensis]